MTNDDLRGHLQAIRDQHGRLTPALVVEAARPKNSPLHTAVFDRSPKEAAEAWYRERAHQLIRKARITYVAQDEIRDVRAFQCVRTPDSFVYEPSEEVAQDPFMRTMVLRDMERDWRTLRARYGHFEEFVELITRDIGGGEARTG